MEPQAVLQVSIEVVLTGDSIAAGDTTQASATVRDQSGNVLRQRSRQVTWASSDSSVAKVGATTGLVVGQGPGTATIFGTLRDASGHAGIRVTPSDTIVSPPPSPPPPPDPPPTQTLTGVSRSAGSSAGGTRVILTGTNFAAGAVVTFGGTPASSVTVVSSTSIDVRTPARATGVVDVSVTQSGAIATLPAAFEYLPAPSVTYFSHGFEDNTLGALKADVDAGGSVTASTDVAFAGTRSAKAAHLATSGGASSLIYDFLSVKNPALTSASGVYMRWYVYVPTATMTLSRATSPFTAQIKLHLFRQTSGSGQPGWLMCGVGADFPPGTVLACFVDNGILNIPGGTTSSTLGDGVWLEIQVWYRRSGGLGRSRMWVNGQRLFDVTNPVMGSDDPAAIYRAYFGGAYVELPTGPSVVYVDNVAAANGFIDP